MQFYKIKRNFSGKLQLLGHPSYQTFNVLSAEQKGGLYFIILWLHCKNKRYLYDFWGIILIYEILKLILATKTNKNRSFAVYLCPVLPVNYLLSFLVRMKLFVWFLCAIYLYLILLYLKQFILFLTSLFEFLECAILYLYVKTIDVENLNKRIFFKELQMKLILR